MGPAMVSRRSFDVESKTTFDPYSSAKSFDHGSYPYYPAQESTLHLFEPELSSDEQQWRFEVRDWLVFICIIILAMMDAFDSTAMIAILPDIANAFDTPLISTLWVNTIYLVASATSQLFFTMMCDVFSLGPVWIAAVVGTTIGTGICSGSMTLIEIVVGRLLQGVGGGGALSLCFVIMEESVPQSVQSRYSCYILLTRLIGFVLGPIMGGIFADNTNWTWAFYFNFIFCALGLLAIPFAVDLRVSKNIPLRKLRVLDWAGAAMASFGMAAILVGISWGGVSYGWDQWQALVPLGIGAAVILVLVFYESKCALHPQFGARVFRDLSTTMTYIGCFCHGFVIFCQLQFFTFYFLCTRYFSVTLSGVTLFAITGFAVTPAAVVGILLANESKCSKWIISGGWILTTLAAGCSILLNSITPTVGWVVLFLTAGLGHGLLLSSYNIRVQNMPKIEESALSTKPVTMSLFMQAWGMAVAVPIGGVLFLTFFGNELQSIGLEWDLVNTARGYIVLMDQTLMSDGEREIIKDASASALQVVWEVIAGVAALGCISSIFLWKRQ
ncbi:hypothetical protein N7466_002908 [Penicillium verhagenii]|uniref:uncharacterized protein n=1 Tax=Penicillium verhagenii TaxID=1562060 RepID=UPI00254548C8|nr:uncharacterized protein N7466_002908 [Penicillium verhagenii]KAJ5939774.1 hypothetical protein N7466_002908 [Penicillium verhagenii]